MDDTAIVPDEVPRPAASPSNSRSFSDPPICDTTLQPSPIFQERLRKGSKDDHAVPTTPRQTRRPDFRARGLSLQMPSPAQFQFPTPLSPQLDQREICMHSQQNGLSASPATSLPRHSRGLDFSRACTNLHHSTLAESSPDSSPIILQKGLMMARPRKGSVSSMMLDSPNISGLGSVPWGLLMPERSTVSSSVGSVNMLASESENSESDDDASMGGEDNDDPILTTPQVHKLQNPNAPTPFTCPAHTPSASVARGNGNHFSPAQASLMKTIRRTRLQKSEKSSRKSSSSASGSGYSSMASPRTTSPPPLRSIESAANGSEYFPWAPTARSRRKSLALGTDGLQLSSGNDSGDEASLTAPSTPGVVRRPVTRRGNLLPKTKGFARIRAALAEEATPVDADVRRESETMKQVRERDNSIISELDITSERPSTATAASSPTLLPAVPESAQEQFGTDLESETLNGNKGLGMNFAVHASRNSGGLDYWHRFDPSMRTPPLLAQARQNSSILSDINMDSPAGLHGEPALWRRPRARSSASDASEAFAPTSSNNPVAASSSSGIVHDDVHLKKFKRRREDDIDIATIKRRAVSPGMSAQNSPVLTNSPSQRDGHGGWGQPPERKEKSSQAATSASSDSSQQLPLQAVRSNSGGNSMSVASTSTLTGGGGGGVASQGKKLGLQGMVDTNDGLMKMSIE